MQKIRLLSLLVILMTVNISTVYAQNWDIILQDNATGTPANQINGFAGGTTMLYGTLFNFTGTPGSDDGTGTNTIAPATTLDFAGFGFTQNPGQYDLNNIFTPADAPGLPLVDGSSNGSVPGSSGYRSFGTFNLSGLAPGTYREDFTASAFPDDFNSTVPFNDINGTLTLNVTPSSVPEPSSTIVFGIGIAVLGLVAFCRSRRSC